MEKFITGTCKDFAKETICVFTSFRFYGVHDYFTLVTKLEIPTINIQYE